MTTATANELEDEVAAQLIKNGYGWMLQDQKEEAMDLSASSTRDEEPEEAPRNVTLIPEIANKHSNEMEATKVKATKVKSGSNLNLTNELENTNSVLIKAPFVYRGEGEIPDSVTHLKVESVASIPNRAFYAHNSLREIELCDTKEIGDEAFAKCSSLTCVKFPSTLRSIGRQSFWECSSLQSITLPPGLTTMGEEAFGACMSLVDTLVIPSSLKRIPKSAFQGCFSLYSVVIESRVKKVESCAFKGCTSLESIIVPFTIDFVGSKAFQGCVALQNIVLPKTATIEEDTFNDCTTLEKAVLSSHKSNESIQDWLQIRFQDLPLHSLCYSSYLSSSMAEESIAKCLSSNTDVKREKDLMGLTALHVLLWNPGVKLQFLKALLADYPEAATTETNLGQYPLHSACANSSMTLPMIKALVQESGKKSNCTFTKPHPRTNYLPVTMAMHNNLSRDIQDYLYDCHPVALASIEEGLSKPQVPSSLRNRLKDMEDAFNRNVIAKTMRLLTR